MRILKVIGKAARFMPGAGMLALTHAQYEARLHALMPAGKNEYIIKQPVEFKCGEVLGFTGEISKALLEITEEPRHIPQPVAQTVTEKTVEKEDVGINPIADFKEKKHHVKR